MNKELLKRMFAMAEVVKKCYQELIFVEAKKEDVFSSPLYSNLVFVLEQEKRLYDQIPYENIHLYIDEIINSYSDISINFAQFLFLDAAFLPENRVLSYLSYLQNQQQYYNEGHQIPYIKEASECYLFDAIWCNAYQLFLENYITYYDHNFLLLHSKYNFIYSFKPYEENFLAHKGMYKPVPIEEMLAFSEVNKATFWHTLDDELIDSFQTTFSKLEEEDADFIESKDFNFEAICCEITLRVMFFLAHNKGTKIHMKQILNCSATNENNHPILRQLYKRTQKEFMEDEANNIVLCRSKAKDFVV